MDRRLAIPAALAAALALGAARAQEPEPPKKEERKLPPRTKGPLETEEAIERSVRWLAAHQEAVGHWDPAAFSKRCRGGECAGAGRADLDVPATALATLALVRAGYVPGDPTKLDRASGDRFVAGDVVRKALDWLCARQDDDGSFGPQGPRGLTQAIATLAVVEAHERARTPALARAAQKGVLALVAARAEGSGWRSTSAGKTPDVLATGWSVAALRSAKRAGLEVPPAAAEGAFALVDRLTDLSGLVAYDTPGVFSGGDPAKSEACATPAALAALGLLIRPSAFPEEKKLPAVQLGVRWLAIGPPRWDPDKAAPDVDGWFHGTAALARHEGLGGATFRAWNKSLHEALRATQRPKKEACAEGSWDLTGKERWAFGGGRVYATAMGLLTLVASASGPPPDPKLPADAKPQVPETSPRVKAIEKALLARVKAWLEARKALACKACKATGRAACARCEGEGQLLVPSAPGKKKADLLVNCSACRASGLVDCDRCDAGIVPKKVTELEVGFGFCDQPPVAEYTEKSIVLNLAVDESAAFLMVDVRYLKAEKPTPEISPWEPVTGGAWKLRAAKGK